MYLNSHLGVLKLHSFLSLLVSLKQTNTSSLREARATSFLKTHIFLSVDSSQHRAAVSTLFASSKRSRADRLQCAEQTHCLVSDVPLPIKHLFCDKLNVCCHVTRHLRVLCHHVDSKGSWTSRLMSGSDGLRKRATSSPRTSHSSSDHQRNSGHLGRRVFSSVKLSCHRRTFCGCQAVPALIFSSAGSCPDTDFASVDRRAWRL